MHVYCVALRLFVFGYYKNNGLSCSMWVIFKSKIKHGDWETNSEVMYLEIKEVEKEF